MDRMELMRSYLDTVVAGDLEKAATYYSDDIEFHWAGTGPMSGDYHGVDDYMNALRGFLAGGVSISVEEHDLLANDTHGIVLNRGTYTKGGESFTTNRVVVYHFDGDKISEVWVVDTDQAGVAAFFGS